MKKVALIGGKGLENIKNLSDAKKVKIETPYGNTSSDLTTGKLDGVDIVHLARHGNENKIPSCFVNFRANFYALKQLGCTHIFTTSSCGSLHEEICPGELIVIDQFIDFTKHRSNTIYTADNSISTSMANPFNTDLKDDLTEAAIMLKHTLHTRGTVITIDGPRFSTRAESYLFKTWGADIINMSTATEVIIATELKMPIAAISLCTGFDSWRTDIKTPTADEVNEVVEKNSDKLLELVKIAVSKI